MLAMLQDAVECFQNYVLAEYVWEKKVPSGARLDFERRIPIGLFRLRIYAKPYS
jgi:hypothetical protein